MLALLKKKIKKNLYIHGYLTLINTINCFFFFYIINYFIHTIQKSID